MEMEAHKHWPSLIIADSMSSQHRPQRTHIFRFIQLAMFSNHGNFIPIDSLTNADRKFTKFPYYLWRKEMNKTFKVYCHNGLVINDGAGQLCDPSLMANSVTPSAYVMTSP